MSKQDLSRSELWFFALLAVALLLIMFAGRTPGSSGTAVALGTPLPEMMASGWINAETIPSRESLRGKVVVVDCWATWCPPCRKAMPELAELYEEYKPLGVEFIGLTPETERERSNVEGFIGSIPGFDWPVGIGARPTLEMLGISAFPTVIVFGTNGTATWSGNHLDGIESALDEALGMAK